MQNINEITSLFFNLKNVKFFSMYGLIAIVLISLPSFIFMKKAHKTRPDDLDVHSIQTARSELVARALLNFTFPLIGTKVEYLGDTILYIALIALALYYVQFIIFAIRGSYYPDIYMKKFLGVLPIPFDIFNVIFFIAASIYLVNIFSLTLSVFYGACRILNAIKAMKDLNSRV